MIFVTFTHFYGYKLSIVQNQVSAHPRVLLKVDAIDSTGIHLGSLRNLLGRHHLWARSGCISVVFLGAVRDHEPRKNHHLFVAQKLVFFTRTKIE